MIVHHQIHHHQRELHPPRAFWATNTNNNCLATSSSRHLADCDVAVVPLIVVIVFAFNRWENCPCQLILSVRASKLGALSLIFNLHTNFWSGRNQTSDVTQELPPDVDTPIKSRRVILVGVRGCGFNQTIRGCPNVDNLFPNTIGDSVVNVWTTSYCLVWSYN